MRATLSLLGCWTALAVALNPAQIASVFGAGATGLTGSSTVLPKFTLAVVTNSTHALVSINATSTAVKQAGWYAIGVGAAMASCQDYAFAWPTTSGSVVSWTLSQRRGSGSEDDPVFASSTTSPLVLVPSLSTTSPTQSFTVVSYMRLLSPPASSGMSTFTRSANAFIYASGSSLPAAGASSQITQHDQAHRAIRLDLSPSIALPATSSPSPSPSTSGQSAVAVVPAASGSAVPTSNLNGGGATASTGTTSRDKILVIHAVLASLAFLIVMPVAILIPRYLRHLAWFRWHAALQSLALLLVIIVFATGFFATGTPHLQDGHTRFGTGLFAVLLVQVVLGATAHWKPSSGKTINPSARFPTIEAKTKTRLVHMALGLVVAAAGMAQVYSGFSEWAQNSDAGSSVPVGLKAVFYVLVVLFWLAFVGGVVKEGRTSHYRSTKGFEMEEDRYGSAEPFGPR